MAYSANGYEFTDKTLSRVSYDLLTDELVVGGTPSDNFKHKGSAPELIKMAINTASEATFFGAAPTYTPIYFDGTALSYNYGDQIFTDVANQKNLVWLSEALTGDCLDEMNDFINNPA